MNNIAKQTERLDMRVTKELKQGLKKKAKIKRMSIVDHAREVLTNDLKKD